MSGYESCGNKIWGKFALSGAEIRPGGNYALSGMEVRFGENYAMNGMNVRFGEKCALSGAEIRFVENYAMDNTEISPGNRRKREIVVDGRKQEIVRYWTKRSDSFLKQRRAELHSLMAERWMKEIRRQLPQGRRLKILDVGCGAGFFSVLLAKDGHQVTGIDLTPDMIEDAKILAGEEGVCCTLQVMDAENLAFPDENFDVVLSRNLTWTLPHVRQAYQEWVRVLKHGGMLLNFDANYGASDSRDKAGLPKQHAHNMLSDEMLRECEKIKRQLPISFCSRPAWDLETLSTIKGLERFQIDLGISGRIYIEKDEFYNPVPMFMICAGKQ